jgi:DNA helicase-2/ATP-dependent DNA helicase PcrA
VVRLETNYRSTPQVLAVANRLVPALGGARKELRPIADNGPEPILQVSDDEGGWIAQRIAELHRDERVSYEEIAVVYRVNARSEDFEEALADAGIPYQVRGGAFLSRPAARSVLRRLGRNFDLPAGTATAEAARLDGFLEQLPEGLGEEERTRQADLRRLVQLADAFDGSAADFATDLARRFGSEGEGRGVHLLTYHRAKGLEWDAVFLPALAAGELPARQAKTKTAIDEERRLLYVGITRARRFLFLSRPAKAKPSPFLAELGLEGHSKRRASAPGGREGAGRAAASDRDGPYGALRAWRKERAQADGVPAYVVFHDRTLEELAARLPRHKGELLDVPGVGPAKVERYGSDVLAVLARFGAS